MDTVKVAIVLLSYNSKKLLEQFLPKIIEHTPKNDDFQIVLVDNASEDGTLNFVQSSFPNVRTIRLEVNKGFTNGYCESLPQIDAEYFVLISSDVEVGPNWCGPIIDYMDRNPRVAACGPKIMSYDDRNLFEYAGAAGGYMDHLGYPFCRGRIIDQLERDEGQYDSTQEVFWTSGACMFVRAKLYFEAGGLDNDFYAHMEEIDLCWRLKNMGYSIAHFHESRVYHMGGFIIKYGSPAKVFRNHRNNLIMLFKNLPFGQMIWKIPLRMFMDLATLFKMYVDGEFKASTGINKAHYQFFRYMGRWMKGRKAAQKLRSNPNATGIYGGSLVWNYFVKGKRKFSEFNWNP